MKTILSIDAEKLSEIEDDKEREFAEFYLSPFNSYHRDYHLNDGVIARKSIIVNNGYINTLFMMADFLYQYYEFSQRHFELLEFAANDLIRLYERELSNLLRDNVDNTAEELNNSLNQVALIFQVASDNTQNKACRKTYQKKAIQYSKKADDYGKVFIGQTHEEKILGIYEKAAGKYSKRPFLAEIFHNRADEYREKCETRSASQTSTFLMRFFKDQKKPPEKESLLGGLTKKRI